MNQCKKNSTSELYKCIYICESKWDFEVRDRRQITYSEVSCNSSSQASQYGQFAQATTHINYSHNTINACTICIFLYNETC